MECSMKVVSFDNHLNTVKNKQLVKETFVLFTKSRVADGVLWSPSPGNEIG